MWQFMPNDKFYGLAKSAMSTSASTPKNPPVLRRYMKFIYDQLGDWYLAMAGYDWGTGRIQQAVQKTGYADYWELYKRNNLPGETKNYVPEILARHHHRQQPTHYGFDDVTYDPLYLLTPSPSTIPSTSAWSQTWLKPRSTNSPLSTPASCAWSHHPIELRPASPRRYSHLIRAAVALIPETRRNAWRYHRLAADDTLASLAREFRVSESELASANQLHSGDTLHGLEAVVVPLTPPAAPATRMVFYAARRATLWSPSLTASASPWLRLRRWNHLTVPASKLSPAAASM